MTIYVHIDGSFFKATEKLWRCYITDALAGCENTSILTALRKRPAIIWVDDGVPSLIDQNSAHVLVDCSRWDRDDWFAAAYRFNVLKDTARIPMVEVEKNVYVAPDLSHLSREGTGWVLKDRSGREIDRHQYINDLGDKHKLELLHRHL